MLVLPVSIKLRWSHTFIFFIFKLKYGATYVCKTEVRFTPFNKTEFNLYLRIN